MKVRYFAVVFLIHFIQLTFAQQNFENAVTRLLEKPEFRNAIVGIHLSDLNSGNTLYSLNGNKLLIPASTLKLITTATALEKLGADYRFATRIAFTGKIKDGNLKGDLVIVSGGDPTLGSEYFEENNIGTNFLDVWATKIKEAGIQKVDGNFILDGSIYDSERIPDTWIWGDIGNYYGSGANAFTVYDNLFRITFKSPKESNQPTKITSVFPKIEGIEFTNEVLSSDINRDLAFVYGSPFDKTRIIKGTIPKNRKAFTIKASIPKPEELLAKDLILHLANNGIFVKDEILYEKTNLNKLNTIYIHESPPLEEIVKVLNFESVNLFAEHLLKQLSAEETGIGDRKKAIEIVNEYWKSKGFSSQELIMEDGSGLSHFNAVTPEFLTSVLNYMYNSKTNSTSFINSLPTVGEGTLKSFNQAENFVNTLKAKSGSMTRIRCYAGYLKTDSGKNLCFAIMFNQFSGSHSNLINEIENLLSELIKSN